MARLTLPKTLKRKELDLLPEHDLKPIMVSFNRSEPEFFIREHNTRSFGTKQQAEYADVPRLFCRLSDYEGKAPQTDQQPQEAIESGNAQLAVALATIVLPASQTEPQDHSFVKYVYDRTRLADKIVVAGYTGDKLSMRKSEILGLERARAVRRLLIDGGVKCEIAIVSRPRCNFSKTMKFSHRIEITGLFHGSSGPEEKGSAGKKKKGKKASGSSGSNQDANFRRRVN